MKKTLIGNLYLTIFSLLLLGLTKVIFNVSIGRSFGADTLGSINVAISTSLLLSYIITSGLPPAASKFLAEQRGRGKYDDSKSLITLLFILVVLISLAVMGGALLFGDDLSKYIGIQKDLFVLSTALIPLYALYMFYKNVYYGLDEIKIYLKIELLSDIIFFILLIIFIFFIKSLLILPFIIMYIVFSIISLYNLRNYLILSLTNFTQLHKDALIFAVISFAGTFASNGRSNLSITLSGTYVNTTSVGLYASAFSLLAIFQFIPMALSRVISPAISFQYGKEDIDSVSKLLNISTTYLMIILSFMCALGIILSSQILQLLYGIEFISASTVLCFMIISVYFSIISMPSISSLTSTKYIKIPNIAGFLGFIASIGAWIILIPLYGIEGTAVGFLIGTLVNISIPLYYANKYFKLDIKRNVNIFCTTAIILILTLLVRTEISYYPNITSAILFVFLFIAVNRKNVVQLFLFFIRKGYCSYKINSH